MNFEDTSSKSPNKIFSHWGNILAMALIIISLILLAFQLTGNYRQSKMANSETGDGEELIQAGEQVLENQTGMLKFTHPQFPKLEITHDDTWKIMSKSLTDRLGDLESENLELSLTKKTTIIKILVSPTDKSQVTTKCYSETEKPFTSISAVTLRVNKDNGGDYWKKVAAVEKSADPSRFQMMTSTLDKNSSKCLENDSCAICYSSTDEETAITSTKYPLPKPMINPDNPTNTYPALITASVTQSVVDPEVLQEADKIVDDFVKRLQ